MKHFTLNGEIRKIGNKAVIKAFRKQGLVPCNLYGQGIENVFFTIPEKVLKGVTHTPSSYIIDLQLSDGTSHMAILHELQFHPVEDNCLHVDFLKVSEDKPVAIKVPLNITGHAVGVQAGGKFVKVLRTLKVSALMKDLPDQLDIDITHMQIGDNIVVGDLKYEGLDILTPKSTIVCSVKSTRQSAQAAAAAQ